MIKLKLENIKNATDYPEYLEKLKKNPEFNMIPLSVFRFLEWTYCGKEINFEAIRYDRPMEQFDEKFQGIPWSVCIEKITFDGEDAILYIVDLSQTYCKKIKSGELLNLPPIKEKTYNIVMEKRPNTIATIIDCRYINHKEDGEFKYEDSGFEPCEMP